MFAVLLTLLRCLLPRCGNYRQLVLENFALRHQILILQRQRRRPKLRSVDRWLWVMLQSCWPNWKAAALIFRPETVIGWQRAGFRAFWRWKSRRRGGRPSVDRGLIQLIRRMWEVNPTWGSPRIRDELAKLGISASTSTIRKYRPKSRRGPSQNWRTFLQNHAGAIVAIDFLVVPTVTFRLLYVFLVLSHARRKVIHWNLTEAPTAAWTAQQIVNAFPDDTAPEYLLRDRDSVYGSVFVHRINGLGIKQKVTAPRSPWQSPYVERLIGSIRRECLDRMMVFGPAHLRRILQSYFAYYHEHRLHRSLEHDSPVPRAVEPPDQGQIIEFPWVGGLHHRYGRRAA